jgi:hypothetical protein
MATTATDATAQYKDLAAALRGDVITPGNLATTWPAPSATP